MLFFLLAFYGIGLYAADEPLQFEDPARQGQYLHLLEELRCLVCQNQTLADSHAELAQDLRKEVYRMVEDGQSNTEIIEFLVSRYGDFVLYRPPVKWSTVLLWFGPFVLLLVALFSMYRFIRMRKATDVVLSSADQVRLARILDTTDTHKDGQ
jgi:cytochrome c-type biogenesis protein CcmH